MATPSQDAVSWLARAEFETRHRCGGGCPASGFVSDYAVTSRSEKVACQGVVFEPLLACRGMPGFARSYAVTGFVQNEVLDEAWCRKRGSIHGEKQRPMVLAAGWMGGDGAEPSAGSAETPRPQSARHHAVGRGQWP